MGNIPYLYVNIVALCLYVVLFTAFLSAKRTPENRAFLAVLLCFTLWSGGSVLMRLQMYPGMSFWFYVSLLSLFCVPVCLYWFVCRFAGTQKTALGNVWMAGTALILVFTAFGTFLQPPIPQLRTGGQTVFLYNTHWPILIPTAFFTCIVASIIHILISRIKKSGLASGFTSILVGCLAVAVGNLVQILPGNTFPYDTLGGIVFALCLVYAMHQKRLFHLDFLYSPNMLMMVLIAACFIITLYTVPVLESSVIAFVGANNNYTTLLVVGISILAMLVVFLLGRRLIFGIFSKKEHQNVVINRFSQAVNQTLKTAQIVQELTEVLCREAMTERVYVVLEHNGWQLAQGMANPNQPHNLALKAEDFGFGAQLATRPYCYTEEITADTPAGEGAKALLETLDISCVLPLRTGDELIGLVLLPRRGRGRRYPAQELGFYNTLGAIASIAIKNASLYERIYREARLDSLTGLYNYNFFVETVRTEFEKNPGKPLALVYLDIDDMKLYNQLYGSETGDHALQTVAQVILQVVKDKGISFRHSGKVFAILLPGLSAARAQALAAEIQQRVQQETALPDGRRKPITLSGGICAAPEGAKTAAELMEYADIAVFNAKNSGKGKINVFQSITAESKQITGRVMQIISQAESRGHGSFSSYSATILALTAAIDAKDHYTYNHSQNVAYYASMLAVAAGLADSQVRLVYEAALLHDIGKISIPENILGKTDSLSAEEQQIMETHVENSIEIIRHLPSMDYVIPVAVAHHERWDGTGYPRGIAGEEIPVAARCLAVADSFDAITSDRPYRPGQSLAYAIKELEENSGKQFDPYFAGVFLSLIHRKEIIPR